MWAHRLCLAFLAVLAFALATVIEPWFQTWAGNRAHSKNLLETALGDGRRLFANQFFAKADAYFHNGYSPSIYDGPGHAEKPHLSAQMHEEEEEEEGFLGKPKDWLDAFSRHFYPSRHTHLGDSGCGHSCCQRPKDSQEHCEACEREGTGHIHRDSAEGEEREILPWLRLSAEMDSSRPETYTVGAFWLRTKLGRVTEAEQFLREGLQVNPESYQILFELGQIYEQNRHDSVRARNVWEVALRHWHAQESQKTEPDLFAYAQILNSLASLEWNQRQMARSIEYLQALKAVSPNKETIQKWIEAGETQLKSGSTNPPPWLTR